MSIPAADRELLHARDVEGEGLADWRMLFGALHARFVTGGFSAGADFVGKVAAAADEADHHPDVDLTYPRVDVRLSSHDVGGVTGRDVRLARRISDLAAEAGFEARPGETSVLELGLDTPDRHEIAPFWAALLGYRSADEGHELRDPDGTMPTIWFQTCEPGEAPPQRWHLDLRIPPEAVEQRIAGT